MILCSGNFTLFLLKLRVEDKALPHSPRNYEKMQIIQKIIPPLFMNINCHPLITANPLTVPSKIDSISIPSVVFNLQFDKSEYSQMIEY